MSKKQFIVIGMGRFGQSVAKCLTNLGKEVLAVDNDPDLINDIAPYVTHAVQADATDEKALTAIGLKNFDVAVVTMGANMQASILITMLCKEMGVNFVLAKAQNEIHAKVLRKTGADKVVFPERDMGMRVAHNLADSGVLDYVEIAGDLRIMDLSVVDGWLGKDLIGLNFRQKYGVNIIAIKKHNQEINTSPHGADILEEGDTLIVAGNKESISRLEVIINQ
jgi:trk system potassium uptake protein TrkA